MGKIKNDLVGRIFGRLRVIERSKNYVSPKGSIISCWKCYCDSNLGGCGSIKIINRSSLISGASTSCGCYIREITSTRLKKKSKNREQYISDKVREKGYFLLEIYLKNNYRRISYQDKYGYKYDCDFYTFNRGYNSQFVSKSNKFSIKNISRWIEINKKPFVLLSKKYKNNSVKLNFRCYKCKKKFEMSWACINNNYGCLKCRKSKGEDKIEEYLLNNKIKYIREYKFNDCKNKQKLPFDFYLPKYDLCIEYNGMQHYKETGYFGKEEKLKRTKRNDTIRKKYCKKNNIKLIIIPYWKFDNIENILDKEIIGSK